MKKPPRQLGVLSFAGLDTYNTLHYPLLAHELGHFIDYSYSRPLYLNPSLRSKYVVSIKDVLQVLAQDENGSSSKTKADAILKELVQRAEKCVRELLADLLATRMLGFAFFVPHAEFLKSIGGWPEPTITKRGYPGARFRLSVIFEHLMSNEYPQKILGFFRDGAASRREAGELTAYLKHWRTRLSEKNGKPIISSDEGPVERDEVQQRLEELLEKAIRNTVPSVIALARSIIPDEKCPQLTRQFYHRISRLKHDLPPIEPMDGVDCFAEIMAASWAFQILYGKRNEHRKHGIQDKYEEYHKRSRLTLKAIELIPLSKRPRAQPQTDSTQEKDIREKQGTLSTYTLRRRIGLPIDHPSYLGVIPYNADSIRQASVEVHLGNWFVVARRIRLTSVQPWSDEHKRLLKTAGREEFFIPDGDRFLIHPGDLVLGVTNEFFSVPSDLMAFVEGKSGLGRLGLIVATATHVAPGFHGVIVLELVNAGTVPLELIPGNPIAQLVFQTMTSRLKSPDLYRGRSQCQIKP